MKMLVYGDLHWSQYSSIVRERGLYFSTRLQNNIDSLDWVETLSYEKGCEKVICVGELAKEIYEGAKEGKAECHWYPDKKELTDNIRQLIEKGDTVLVKASHGMGFAGLVSICSSHTWL